MSIDGEEILDGRQLVNATVVRRLRVEKRWTRGLLAKKARCSERTIKNIEKENKYVYLNTLTNIANAFGVDPAKLVVREELFDPAEVVLLKAQQAEATCITVNSNFQDFDETVDLPQIIQELKELIGTKGKIIIIAISEGNSVDISVHMQTIDTNIILHAFSNGKLRSLNVMKISVSIKGDVSHFYNRYIKKQYEYYKGSMYIFRTSFYVDVVDNETRLTISDPMFYG